jgi:hypothetical protein
MTNLDYREVWYKDKIVGAIAQDTQAKIYVRAIDNHFELILSAFIGPISIETTSIEGDISVSGRQVVLPSTTKWLSILDQGIPPEYFVSIIDKTNLTDFNKMDF